MIPSNTLSFVDYIGDGSSSDFSITFPTFENENIIAEILVSGAVTNTLVQDTDFSLSRIGIPNQFGTLTLIDAGQAWVDAGGELDTGFTLRIRFNAGVSQPARLRDLGSFAPEMIERALDRIAMSALATKDATEDATTVLAGGVYALQTDLDAVDTRVDALEAADISLDGRLDALEAQTLDARLDVLEAQTLDARIDALEINDAAQDLELVDHESRILALESAPAPAGDETVSLQNANFTAAFGNVYVVTGTVSAQLPAPVANKKIRFVISATGPLTLVRNGAENIHFVAANHVVSDDKASVTLTTNGTDWYFI